ncbi:MAG TPA: glycosyltransferase family 4 protein, partial [Bryobacteraceae bacterium]
QFSQQDPRPKVRQEYDRWLNFETRWLRQFDGVFVMSQQDRDEVTGVGASCDSTYVIPNGVDLDRYAPLPPASASAPEIFYVGSFRHQPNLLGFDELRTRIMPRVWEKFPTAILRVVAGPEHEKHWRTSLKSSLGPDASIPQLDPRIVIHGFVADLAPLYATADLVVVPLPLSAGTNIKVMEAMACRRAVVTTPVGAQGLGLQSGHDVMICPLGEEFAAAICSLLDDPSLRDRIAGQARATAEDRFSWKSIAGEMRAAYADVIGRRLSAA